MAPAPSWRFGFSALAGSLSRDIYALDNVVLRSASTPNRNPNPDPNPNPNPHTNPHQACRQCVTPPHFQFTLDQRGPYKGLCCFYPAGATGCDESYDNACRSFGEPFELQPEPEPEP